MYRKTATVINPSGLHARPASLFVKRALSFPCAVHLARAEQPDKRVNAKSILLVLTLGATRGTEVEISAEGEQEQQAVEALAAFLREGCGETAE